MSGDRGVMSTGPVESFSALLSEKMAELEASEGLPFGYQEETAVDRLRHDAQQSVLAIEGGPLPKQGARAYWSSAVPLVEPGHRHLNILS